MLQLIARRWATVYTANCVFTGVRDIHKSFLEVALTGLLGRLCIRYIRVSGGRLGSGMLGADPDPGLPLRLSICLCTRELLSKGCSAGVILEESEKGFEMVLGDAVRITGGGGGMMGRKESVRCEDLGLLLRRFRRWRRHITSPTMTKPTTTRARMVNPMANFFL